MKVVTVILPVFNGARYLRDSIGSILAQTFVDFELLVIDDGSNDESVAIAASIADPRLKILRNESNLGLVRTLNRAVGFVQTPLIARMDADDVAYPERLAHQVSFMEAQPEVGVLGTWASDLETGDLLRRPVSDVAIKTELLSNSPMIHPSVMLRTPLLTKVPYSDRYPHAEDYKLWSDLSAVTLFHNLSEPLLRYRAHPGQVSAKNGGLQRTSRMGIARDYLAAWLGRPVSDEEFDAHLELIGVTASKGPSNVGPWVASLREARRTASFETRFELEMLISARLGALLDSLRRETRLRRLGRRIKNFFFSRRPPK